MKHILNFVALTMMVTSGSAHGGTKDSGDAPAEQLFMTCVDRNVMDGAYSVRFFNRNGDTVAKLFVPQGEAGGSVHPSSICEPMKGADEYAITCLVRMETDRYEVALMSPGDSSRIARVTPLTRDGRERATFLRCEAN